MGGLIKYIGEGGGRRDIWLPTEHRVPAVITVRGNGGFCFASYDAKHKQKKEGSPNRKQTHGELSG